MALFGFGKKKCKFYTYKPNTQGFGGEHFCARANYHRKILAIYGGTVQPGSVVHYQHIEKYCKTCGDEGCKISF